MGITVSRSKLLQNTAAKPTQTSKFIELVPAIEGAIGAGLVTLGIITGFPPVVAAGIAFGGVGICIKLLEQGQAEASNTINKRNIFGEEIGNIDKNKTLDVDKALKALKEFHDKQDLPQQSEIKNILVNIISTLERLKRINNKGNLAVGDQPELRANYVELDEALDKLWKSLRVDPDIENEIILPEWQKLSTGFKILKKAY